MGSRILCIEDNPDNLLLFRRILEAAGHTILQAQKGYDGLTIAENEPVDLILLDVNLPDIDGYEVTRRLRASPKVNLSTIPIMVISANALHGDAQKALGAGCDLYMTKPIDINLFSSKVAFFLQKETKPV